MSQSAYLRLGLGVKREQGCMVGCIRGERAVRGILMAVLADKWPI